MQLIGPYSLATWFEILVRIARGVVAVCMAFATAAFLFNLALGLLDLSPSTGQRLPADLLVPVSGDYDSQIHRVSTPHVMTLEPLEGKVVASLHLDTASIEVDPGNWVTLLLTDVSLLGKGFLWLVVLTLSRRFTGSLGSSQGPFRGGNAGRLRRIGLCLLAIEAIDYGGALGQAWYVKQHFAIEGLVLHVFQFPDLGFLFVALLVLVIGEVFRQGRLLQTEVDQTL